MVIGSYDNIRQQGVCPVHWPRAIALVDINAFFASVERLAILSVLGSP